MYGVGVRSFGKRIGQLSHRRPRVKPPARAPLRPPPPPPGVGKAGRRRGGCQSRNLLVGSSRRCLDSQPGLARPPAVECVSAMCHRPRLWENAAPLTSQQLPRARPGGSRETGAACRGGRPGSTSERAPPARPPPRPPRLPAHTPLPPGPGRHPRSRRREGQPGTAPLLPFTPLLLLRGRWSTDRGPVARGRLRSAALLPKPAGASGRKELRFGPRERGASPPGLSDANAFLAPARRPEVRPSDDEGLRSGIIRELCFEDLREGLTSGFYTRYLMQCRLESSPQGCPGLSGTEINAAVISWAGKAHPQWPWNDAGLIFYS
nr:uncharacterized protein LOC100976625 [Pan paniscus]